jgi:lipopolysaccharide export system ATP-binding protein
MISQNLLKVHELRKVYQGRAVVDSFSMDVYPGEILGLIGPNGAGKTTSFYMIMGLIRPDSGSVFFEGNEITSIPVHKRARLGMGYLAQEPTVFRSLSVEKNILCILETLPLSKKERNVRLEELLEELNLTKLAKKLAGTLSGGERRRLEITRALVNQPKFLLLDEPFANIDPLAISDVKALTMQLAKKGISILITDHNAREILSLVDRAYLMRDGHAFMNGTPEELVASSEARSSYLGENFEMQLRSNC